MLHVRERLPTLDSLQKHGASTSSGDLSIYNEEFFKNFNQFLLGKHRFFDDDSDGLMNHNNFTHLIKRIRSAKNLTTDSESIGEEVQKYET